MIEFENEDLKLGIYDLFSIESEDDRLSLAIQEIQVLKFLFFKFLTFFKFRFPIDPRHRTQTFYPGPENL